MKKKTDLNGTVKLFSVDYNAIDTNDILHIHRYLMKKAWYETMLRIIWKMFIALLTNIVDSSNYTKSASLSNQKCEIQPIRVNLHPNEYNKEFQCYP